MMMGLRLFIFGGLLLSMIVDPSSCDETILRLCGADFTYVFNKLSGELRGPTTAH